jgi:hypothetical protein
MTTKGKMLMYLLVLVGSLVALKFISPKDTRSPAEIAQANEMEAKRNAEIAEADKKEAEQEDKDSARRQAALITVRDSVRNPDSFVLENERVQPTEAVCLAFRSQNGYGGLNKGLAVTTPDGHVYMWDSSLGSGDPGFRAKYRKYCQ